MNIISVTKDNLEQEHICCAISNNKDCQVAAKKTWLAERFADGLVFKKCDVRGKCFIEYIPAENAWFPIEADGYMHINCFWVSGQFKGQGYSNLLLDECIKDSKEKGKKGIWDSWGQLGTVRYCHDIVKNRHFDGFYFQQ